MSIALEQLGIPSSEGMRLRVATCDRCGVRAASTWREDGPAPFGDWLISDDGRHLCPDCGKEDVEGDRIEG